LLPRREFVRRFKEDGNTGVDEVFEWNSRLHTASCCQIGRRCCTTRHIWQVLSDKRIDCIGQ
jgi:hypothetical protein